MLHGQRARRTVRHFGYSYGYGSRTIAATEPLPDELVWLRARAAALVERAPEDLAETLITRYPAGAGIGWHRDAPSFGSTVLGVSLGAPCRMLFERVAAGGDRLTWKLDLAPRSAYVLSGSARWVWRHRIPPTKDLRYSVTFRTLRSGASDV